MIPSSSPCTCIAAFFDIDGTLIAEPSLELRAFAALRAAGAIKPWNYLRWFARAAHLVPDGIAAIANANKMYLHGVSSDLLRNAGIQPAPNDNSQVPVNPGFAESTRLALPSFLPDALKRAAWHAELGHSIVLVSGTLASLAHRAAAVLAVRLAARNVPASVAVCATLMEQVNGHFTGEIIGEANFGPAKARAIQQIAANQSFNLQRCYAYGNAFGDRWMLAAVGRPAAVNPSRELERIARLHDWPILSWQPNAPTSPHMQCRGALHARPGHRSTTHSSGNLESQASDRPTPDFHAAPQTEPQQ